MQVLRITRPGGPEVLEFDERPAPMPGPSDLLVRVHATGLNRADLLQVRGGYPSPPGVPADVPGLEYAGEVLATGPLVRQFKVGDRVMGLVGGGAFAEQLLTHEREGPRHPGHPRLHPGRRAPRGLPHRLRCPRAPGRPADGRERAHPRRGQWGGLRRGADLPRPGGARPRHGTQCPEARARLGLGGEAHRVVRHLARRASRAPCARPPTAGGRTSPWTWWAGTTCPRPSGPWRPRDG